MVYFPSADETGTSNDFDPMKTLEHSRLLRVDELQVSKLSLAIRCLVISHQILMIFHFESLKWNL